MAKMRLDLVKLVTWLVGAAFCLGIWFCLFTVDFT